MPFTLMKGNDYTYTDQAEARTWIAGPMSDGTHREATLMLTICFVNGVHQPDPEVCFKGQGLRISQQEKNG